MALTGHFLKVAAETWLPYVSFPAEAEQNPSMASGVAVEAFRIVANKLNVSYQLVRPVDGFWGSQDDNGSYKGMVGQLLRGEVDMALGPFVHTSERQNLLDFSEMIVTDSFGIFLPRPGVAKHLSNFLKPLSINAWILTLVSVTFSTALSFLFRKVGKGYELEFPSLSLNNEHRDKTRCPTKKTTQLFGTDWIIRTICRQATASPVHLSDRVLLGTWLFASLVLGSAYCGTLTSQLAVPFIHIPVDSLEQLLRSDMKFASEAGGALQEIIQSAESGVMKEVGERMTTVNSCYNSRFDIKAGKLAVFCDYISMRMITSEEFSENATCSFYVARERISGGTLSFMFPKKSLYKPYFDQQLRHMVAGGMIAKMIDRYTPNGSVCLVSPGLEPGRRQVFAYTITDLGGVFILLLAGCCGGLILLLLELVSDKWLRQAI